MSKSMYAADYLLDKFEFDTVLDVGAGKGEYADRFCEAGKTVTSNDILPLRSNYTTHKHVEADFMSKAFDDAAVCHMPDDGFDMVWCAHFLEHQPDVNAFLSKLVWLVRDGGILCISVPPMKPNIVGGHLTIWNGGLLIYNLVRAGIDCSDCRIKQQGYNISIIIPEVRKVDLPELHNDCGDIELLSEYFPQGLNAQGFNGNIQQLRW